MRACSVTLVRPYSTSYEAFLHDVAGEEEIHHDENLDEWVDTVRDRIEEIAEECNLRIALSEIELRRLESDGASPDGLGVLSYTRRKMLYDAHVLVTLHPPPEVLSLVSQSILFNPIQRAVIGLQRHRNAEDLQPLFAAASTPLLGTSMYVRRLFAANFEKASVMDTALREALLFPEGRAFRCTANNNERLIETIPEGYIDEFGS